MDLFQTQADEVPEILDLSERADFYSYAPGTPKIIRVQDYIEEMF